MRHLRLLPIGAACCALLATLILLWATIHAAGMSIAPDPQETIVLGQSTLSPGSQAALRILVRDHHTGAPIEGAAVRVSLTPRESPLPGLAAKPLFAGKTDATGTVSAIFAVPEVGDAAQMLLVETDSPLGRDRLARPVLVQRAYKILLASDKPIYQPGQTIHMRALALSAFDLTPARDQAVEFVVEDAKGNKVFRQKAVTNAFGVASTDFALATEVNNGAYKLTASLGNVSSEKTVTVKPYVLPKFKVEVTTDKTFYLPGEVVKGTVAANYFFGKAVEGANVSVVGYTFDVARKEAVRLSGKTDPSGSFSFQFNLPAYFVAGGLDQQKASFILEVSVTDKAEHTEQTSLSLPVAADRIVIDVVPESGTLKPGLENILYILTSYPDGSPAACRLIINFPDGRTATLTTGKYGLAEARFTPPAATRTVALTILAQDERGNKAQVTRNLTTARAREYVLLRVDKATARVGDTLHLEAFTTAPSGDVFLDIVRNKQTVSTRVLPVTNGKATADVDLSPDLFGTLEFHAYKVLSDGSIVRDTRLVVVSGAGELKVKITADKETYLPGGQAKVSYQVTDKEGKPVQAALGIAAVDESVFALAEMDPGFARLYFLLEKELLTPKYEIHGFSLPRSILNPSEDTTIRAAQETTARAALAKAPQGVGFGLAIFSYASKQQDLIAARRAAFQEVSEALAAFLTLIPPVILLFCLLRLWQEGVLIKAVGLGLLTGLILALIVALGAVTLLGMLIERNSVLLQAWVIAALPAWLLLAIAIVTLTALAILRRGYGLGTIVLLLATYILGGLLLLFAIFNAQVMPKALAGWLLPAYFLLPAALFLRSVGFALLRQKAALAATLAATLGIALLPISILPLFMVATSPAAPGIGQEAIPRRGPADLGIVPMPMTVPLPTRTPELLPLAVPESKGAAPSQAQEPPRLRQFFPETLFWQPNLITDEQGRAETVIPMADSITTWRLSALASSQKGELGTAQTGLRVFQDFFVDLDLPVSLTQDDEVAIPVAVYSYLPQSQRVRLVIAQEPWFALQDAAEKEFNIQANDIRVVYFRIKAISFGRYRLTITAYGERMSDAIARDITVIPNGKPVESAVSDRLPAGTVARSIHIPEGAIPGTGKVIVKIYPGFLSQAVEGLDSILRMPFGCFEQTSSATYPNVLVLSYMKQTGKATPEIRMKAERYIGLGYQRLTTFEVQGGGFSLFGRPPADTMLSAYGLMEFNDMSRVWSVDKAMIERTARWIVSQQQPDGSWISQMGLTHNATWNRLKNSRLPVTAYIAWALAESGYRRETERGIAYVRGHMDEADDAYVLALVANALAAYDPKDPQARQAVDRLEAMKIVQGEVAYWESKVETAMGAVGKTGSIETTALALYALLRADAYPDTATKAMTYLIRMKDPHGTWYTTQATVLALKSLLLSVSRGEQSQGTVAVRLNGRDSGTIRLQPEKADVVQMLVLGSEGLVTGDNRLEITFAGQGNVLYQIATEYYLPWHLVLPLPKEQELIDISISYDRTTLAVNDIVTASVSIRLTRPGTVNWVIVDLGLPPGFEVLAEDLNALVEGQGVEAPPPGPRPTPGGQTQPSKKSTIKRYDLTGRQIIIYLETLTYGQPVEFSYRLRARYPIKAQTLSSMVYDYYNPDRQKVAAPVTLVVE